MMGSLNKATLLEQIKQAAKLQLISKSEILAAYEKGSEESSVTGLSQSISLTEILFLLGGGIIFLGIAIYVSQHWLGLSSVAKIVITLGSGVAAYVVAVLFEQDSRIRMVGASFFLLAALLIPAGIAVTLNVAGYDFTSNYYNLVSFLSLAVFLSSYFVYKRDLLLIFSIIYGTWFYYAFTGTLYKGSNPDFGWYCTIVAGCSYLFLGRYFDQYLKTSISGFLYGFGIVGFLGSLFVLDLMHKGSVWEWMFPVILAGVIYSSVRIRSGSFLAFGSLFLIAYLLEITDRYFRMSVGWPLTLVLMGFLLIGVGYFYFDMKKKFFTKQ